MKERERERYEVRCTAEPSNRPTSQPPPNLMKQRRVRLLTGEAPSKCLGKVAGCYMTCPRMWKCNVYTFNHVLSHRSPPPPPRIRNYVRLSSPRLLSSFHVVALQRHQRWTTRLSFYLLLGLQTPRVLLFRFRGGRGNNCPSLSRGERIH